MASEYTPNYNLDLYASEDKPNLRDQYNAAMGKIDTQLKANADGVTNVSASVVAATTAANDAKQIAQDAEAAAENAAPINHASTEAIYGLGGTLKYGHVSLAQTITKPTIAEDGIAASPKAVYQFVDNGYATKNHATANGVSIGVASSSQYGHVELTDSASSVGAVSNGVAATPKCVDNKMTAKLAPSRLIDNTNVTLNVGGFGGTITYEVSSIPFIGLVIVHFRSSGITHSSTSETEQVIGSVPSGYTPGTYHQCSLTTGVVANVNSNGNITIHGNKAFDGSGDIGASVVYFIGM